MTTRFLTSLALLTLGLMGCGSDEESAPTGGPNLILDGGVPRLDGGDPTGLADGGLTGPCRGQNGCFSCKPANNTELLNACAEGCQPFDNAKRLPGYQPGKLPQL
jgi:hypothetical protein